MPKVYDKVTADIKPHWLKIKLHNGEKYAEMARIVEKHSLHTICSSGMCPNKAECWGRRTATFMVMGEICTRACKFCATLTGNPLPLDTQEPSRVARSINLMGIRHAVITCVTRDDLPDMGAAHWAEVVKAVKAENPETTVELLIADMRGEASLLDTILASGPDIVGHNIETVEQLTPQVRSKADYSRSLRTISLVSAGTATSKSGLMLGMGESRDEVLRTMDDLREAGCEILTIGQYLRPTAKHWPVAEYVRPETFEQYRQEALERGFSYVASAPLVRSSYLAEEALGSCRKTNKHTV